MTCDVCEKAVMVDSVKLLQGRYQIVEPIARGGMGAVYLAGRYAPAWCVVAIKENLEVTPGSRQQFEREAVILARAAPQLAPGDGFLCRSKRAAILGDGVHPWRACSNLCNNAGRCPWRRCWRSATP